MTKHLKYLNELQEIFGYTKLTKDCYVRNHNRYHFECYENTINADDDSTGSVQKNKIEFNNRYYFDDVRRIINVVPIEDILKVKALNNEVRQHNFKRKVIKDKRRLECNNV